MPNESFALRVGSGAGIFSGDIIAVIYQHQSDGISRGSVWSELGKNEVPENSADADLFKLLFRDLSMGGVIRQHREVDYYGNFIPQRSFS